MAVLVVGVAILGVVMVFLEVKIANPRREEETGR